MTTVAPVFRVKFVGGPADGVMRDYSKDATHIMIHGWTYEATGKRDGDHWIFVRIPKRRWMRALMKNLLASGSPDPRLVPKPRGLRAVKRGRNQKCWCGSGKKTKKCHGGADGV